MGIHFCLLLFLQILCYNSNDAIPVSVKPSMSQVILNDVLQFHPNKDIQNIWQQEPSRSCDIVKPSVDGSIDHTYFEFNFGPYLCVILFDASLRYLQPNSSDTTHNEVKSDIAQKIISETAPDTFCQKMKNNTWNTSIEENKHWVSSFNNDMKEGSFCQKYCVSSDMVKINPLCAYALWIDLSVKHAEQTSHKTPVNVKDLPLTPLVHPLVHPHAARNDAHDTAVETTSLNSNSEMKRRPPLASDVRTAPDAGMLRKYDLSLASNLFQNPPPSGQDLSAEGIGFYPTVRTHQEQLLSVDAAVNQPVALVGNKHDNSVKSKTDKHIPPNNTALSDSAVMQGIQKIQGSHTDSKLDIDINDNLSQHEQPQSLQKNLFAKPVDVSLTTKSATKPENLSALKVTKSSKGLAAAQGPQGLKPDVQAGHGATISDVSQKTKDTAPTAPEITHINTPLEHLNKKHGHIEDAVNTNDHKGPLTSTHHDDAEGYTSSNAGQGISANIPPPADLRQSSVPESPKKLIPPETEKERVNTSVPETKVKEEPTVAKGGSAEKSKLPSMDQMGQSEPEDANQANEGDVADMVPGEPADHEEQKAQEDGALGSRGDEGDMVGGRVGGGQPQEAEEDLLEQPGFATEDMRFIGGEEDTAAKPETAKKLSSDYIEEDGLWSRDQGRITQNDADAGYAHDRFVDAEDSHFFAYFMTMIILCILGYLIFHNKQKILALALEGRARKGSRRRPSTSGYRKLDSNLEEAVTSSCTGSSVTHVIY